MTHEARRMMNNKAIARVGGSGAFMTALAWCNGTAAAWRSRAKVYYCSKSIYYYGIVSLIYDI
jgi:hypothetical protein